MDSEFRNKLDRIAEGVARIDQKTDNLEKWVGSQGQALASIRKDLSDHKESVEAHGIKATSRATGTIVSWLGLVVAAAVGVIELTRKK